MVNFDGKWGDGGCQRVVVSYNTRFVHQKGRRKAVHFDSPPPKDKPSDVAIHTISYWAMHGIAVTS